MEIFAKIIEGDCLKLIDQSIIGQIQLTFFDPPFNQGKDYRYFDDAQPGGKYWNWLREILIKIYRVSVNGATIYFMQREKNTENVLRILREAGWTFQNLIIWKKKTSAVPAGWRFSKQYQIIVVATKGEKPRVFNRLRIDLPPAPDHRYGRQNGVFLTDVWDDIRELTSGYYAGDEPFRDSKGNRIHKQQSPVALLLRIILSSTLPGDTVLDPFAGTGTTLVVGKQLGRTSVGIEIDPEYVELIKERLKFIRPADNILRFYDYYRFTSNLQEIWQIERNLVSSQKKFI